MKPPVPAGVSPLVNPLSARSVRWLRACLTRGSDRPRPRLKAKRKLKRRAYYRSQFDHFVEEAAPSCYARGIALVGVRIRWAPEGRGRSRHRALTRAPDWRTASVSSGLRWRKCRQRRASTATGPEGGAVPSDRGAPPDVYSQGQNWSQRRGLHVRWLMATRLCWCAPPWPCWCRIDTSPGMFRLWWIPEAVYDRRHVYYVTGGSWGSVRVLVIGEDLASWSLVRYTATVASWYLRRVGAGRCVPSATVIARLLQSIHCLRRSVTSVVSERRCAADWGLLTDDIETVLASSGQVAAR